MLSLRLFYAILALIVCTGCKNKNPNIDKSELVAEINKEEPQKEELPQVIIQEDVIEQDTIVTDMRMIGETPQLKDWKNYFLQNNKYKDWDAKDPKQTMIGYAVEKNGKASNVKVMRGSENEDLDKEAVRLIEEGEFTVGKDINGKYIRTGTMAIVVYFPPQK